MKNICIAIALGFILAVNPAVAATKAKIGVVDLQRAVSETKEGIAARATIQKMTEQYNAELKSMLTEIEKLGAELKNDKKPSNDARIEKEKLLQKKNREFQNRKRDAEEDLKLQENGYLVKLVNRLGLLMEKIGDEEGYSAIIDRSSARYVAKESDITAILVKRADSEEAKRQ